MRNALHIIIPPVLEQDFIGETPSSPDESVQVESITVTEETIGQILEKIFSSESVSVWQKL